MKKSTGMLITCSLLFSGVLPTLTSCGKSTDYYNSTKLDLPSTVWKNGDFSTNGFGVVTLKTGVDGDTAHFYDKSGDLIKGRFNGVDTPESTGAVEPWGAAAKYYTTDLLTNAKTIVLESERGTTGAYEAVWSKGPESDSTASRTMVWVWVSDREVSDEDGTGFRLVNLGLVQNGYSAAKGVSDSYYKEIMYAADEYAQSKKLHIWDPNGDPNYSGESSGSLTLKTLYSALKVNPADDNYLEHKYYFEGVVTRKVGSDCYIEEYVYDDAGNLTERYGIYVFSMYKTSGANRFFVPGRKIGFAAIISERYGGYQLHDVTFAASSSKTDFTRDVHFVDTETHNIEDPIVQTGNEFSNSTNKLVNYNCLMKFTGVKVTGGYGGKTATRSDGTNYSNNSMTLYCKDSNEQEFKIRIDDAIVIHYFDDYKGGTAGFSTVTNYTYYVEHSQTGSFTFVGLKGIYQSDEESTPTIQLLVVNETDVSFTAD